MTQLALRLITRLLTTLGVLLILVGGSMWWEQARLEAELLGREERVLLAVTAANVPPLLPDYGVDRTGSPAPTVAAASAVITPTAPAPSATITRRVVRQISPNPWETLPDGSPVPEISPTPDPYPPAQTPPSRLIIPAINLETSVIQMGWETRTDTSGNSYSEWVVPEEAAGWHQNSLLPGHEGNTVLSGHHNVAGEVFRDIVNLEPGAEVLLQADGRTYRYIVEEKYIVKERGEPIEVRRENNRYIEPTPDERLTLVSCWPYESNTHRVIVIARPALNNASDTVDSHGSPSFSMMRPERLVSYAYVQRAVPMLQTERGIPLR